MFVTPRGEPYLLWRAVNEHGTELDILRDAGFAPPMEHRHACA
jgi:hypothetical protein